MREEIDRLDEIIEESLLERIILAISIASEKRKKNMPLVDKSREKAILGKRCNNKFVKAIFEKILVETKNAQKES